MAGEWDVDKLELEVPLCMIMEWNEYLDYELEILTQAVIGVLLAARGMASGGQGNTIKLTDPDQISGFFDALNKGE